jgi:hypothetical protein
MSSTIFQFESSDVVGHVSAVDTTRVYVAVGDNAMATRICVGGLVAIEGSSVHDFNIAVVERITRQLRVETRFDQEDKDGHVRQEEVQDDTISAVLIGTFRTVEGEKRNVFKRGADSFPQIDRHVYFLTAGNLQRLMTLFSDDIGSDKRLQLGHFVADRTAVAVADGNRFFQRHAAILGSTGSGKSWAVALILERAAALEYPNIIVLDMHGEYGPLAEVKNGRQMATRLRIAGPGDLDNPKDDVLFLPHWLLNREEMLSILLDRGDQNAPNQSARFTEHVRKLKDETLEAEGHSEVRTTFTVDSPIPYSLSDLRTRLEEDNTSTKKGARDKDVKGDWNDKLTRFLARLDSKCEDRRYGFLFRAPKSALTYQWLTQQILRLLGSGKGTPGIKIVDFSEVPADVLPVVVGVLARLLYDVQFWMDPRSRTPVTLVCDEAHLYLPVREMAETAERKALDAFEAIAKEGRKYGMSLLIVSQRPHDVSRTILSQCNNFMVLRLTNDQDQNVVRRLMPDSMAGLTEVLPLMDVGEALLLGDAVLLPTRVRLDPPQTKPNSATRSFWSEWATRAPDGNALATAVETLRRQTRPT